MSLNSFRAILLKKAEGNTELQDFITAATDQLIEEQVVDMLEKMAVREGVTENKGRSLNSAVQHFAHSAKNDDMAMMTDALGHHISHYKAALKAGNRAVADQHLSKLLPYMDLASKVSKMSPLGYSFSHVRTQPWEHNYSGVDRHADNGKFVECPKDLLRRTSKSVRPGAKHSFPNYHYLEMPAHPQQTHTKDLDHKGGYPWEAIRFGKHEDVHGPDKGGFLPIRDVEHTGEFVPHPFDSHPVLAHAGTWSSQMGDEDAQKFANDLPSWKQGDAYKTWLADYVQRRKTDPETYTGKKQAGHTYEGIPLKSMPHHTRGVDVSALPEALRSPMAQRLTQQQPAQPATSPEAAAAPEQPASAQPSLVDRAQLTADEHAALQSLPPALRRKLGI